MATYAVGDVQGCYHQLQALLEKISFSAADQLWLCGDLINRGPESLKTLRFIHGLGKQALVVLGNHDLHALAIYYGARTGHPKDTLSKLLQAKDAPELFSWLSQQPLLHHDREKNICMVHAGIPPCWDVGTAKQYAAEIQALCQNPESRSWLYRTAFGNSPNEWHPHLAKEQHCRFIVNALTRMRYVTTTGALQFENKSAPQSSTDRTLQPWFTTYQDSCLLLFGHWAALNGKCPHPKIEALDSGCVWGNSLTAYCLETKQRVTVPGWQHGFF